MEIVIQIVGLGLVTAVLAVILREYRPEIAVQFSIVAGLFIVLMVIGQIVNVVQVITEMSVNAGMNIVFLRSLLRIIGIAFLAEFGSQVCRDAGEGSIAAKIDFAAKIIILVIAMPIIEAVIENITVLIP